MGLAPEDRRRIRVDLREQRVDVGSRAHPVVPMPPEIPVTPEQRPRGTRWRVPKSGDREAAPLWSEVRAPRCMALDDRDRDARPQPRDGPDAWRAAARVPRRTAGSWRGRALGSSCGWTHPQTTERLSRKARRPRIRYALDRSYVLLASSQIEPISHLSRAWRPLGKAQRIEEVTYESPALPLSYSATDSTLPSVARADNRRGFST